MPETGPEVHTPENPTPDYSQEQQNLEQPTSIEALPPQDYVDSLNGFNDKTTAPEAQTPDLNFEVPASELSEATTQEQHEEDEVIAETPNVTEEITETEPSNEVITETSQTETSEVTEPNQVSKGLSKEQLEYAEALDAEIRERELTPVEEVNLKIAMALAAKYPNGLIKSVDKNGNHFAVIKLPTTDTHGYNVTILCKRGVAIVDQNAFDNVELIDTVIRNELVDIDELVDRTPAQYRFIDDYNRVPFNGSSETNFVDLTPDDKLMLKKEMQEAEKYQKSKRIKKILSEL